MECPICGAALPPSVTECAHCAGETKRIPAPSPPDQNASTVERRPFAQITPYAGPYPPAYVQVSSSESRPGPMNMLAKWIGLLWTVIIPICIVLDSAGALSDHTGAPDPQHVANLSFLGWVGLWALVAAPAFLIHRATRPGK